MVNKLIFGKIYGYVFHFILVDLNDNEEVFRPQKELKFFIIFLVFYSLV